MPQPVAQTAYYARPADDLLTGATVSSPDADPAYPAANLIGENAANPAKLLTNTGRWVMQATAAVQPLYAVLIYQYLDSGLDVRIEGNGSDTWGAPAYSKTFTIPGKRLDGPTFQPWTSNVTLRLDPPPTAQPYWSLHIVGTNSQPAAVGRLLLLPDPRTVRFLIAESYEESEAYDTQIVQPTELGVETVYDLGGPRRGVAGVTPVTDAAGLPLQEAADFRALWQTVTGQLHPFVLWPFGLSGEPWLVRFTAGLSTRRHGGAREQYWPFAVKEVSRGMPWP